MEIAFARLLLNHTRLFQQIIGDDAAHRIRFVVKFNVHVLAEATGIIVAVCLGIAKSFQDGVALDKYVFHAEYVEYLDYYLFSPVNLHSNTYRSISF